MKRKNRLSLPVKSRVLILLFCLYSGQVAAQLDTFNIALCNEMHQDEIVRLAIEIKGQIIPIPKVGKSTFAHPLKYINNIDSTCVLIVELSKSVFKLYNLSGYLQSPKWEFCFPQRRRFKKWKQYWFILYDYGGYGIIVPLRYEKNSKGKAILNNASQNKPFNWRKKCAHE